MSEYQYYEFQAIDRPLNVAEQQALRNLSTRACITSTSFTNAYEWGSFKGDPARLMEQYFDLHLYLANWGSRRLMIRWPERRVGRPALQAFLGEVDWVRQRVVGERLILDMVREEMEYDDEDDGSGWLAALSPLRGDVLAGDYRVFYLLWLTAVQDGSYTPDEPEPLPGIGPMTGALEAFARFFQIDPDLVAAAAEQTFEPVPADPSEAHAIITGMPEAAKSSLLLRLFDGDGHVAEELRGLVRQTLTSKAPPVTPRTVAALRARADAIRAEREREKLARRDAEARRAADQAAQTRRARLTAIRRRGESVWREIETEIERRNTGAYDHAAGLLVDLKALAEESGTVQDFHRRLSLIRARHARKARFIERLEALG